MGSRRLAARRTTAGIATSRARWPASSPRWSPETGGAVPGRGPAHPCAPLWLAAGGCGARRALPAVVPAPALRARLPHALVAEPACDAANAESPGTVVVAATEERAADARAPRSPWSLWWSRGPRGWALAAAAPGLQYRAHHDGDLRPLRSHARGAPVVRRVGAAGLFPSRP